MTPFSEQFSAVRKAQFDFFDSLSTQAIESAGRLAALNLAVSRDLTQRSLGAGFALLSSRDPRDVLVLGGQAEDQVRSLFAYGRELLGIASSVRPYAVPLRLLALAKEQAVETVEVVEQSVAAPLEAVASTVVEATTEPVVVAGLVPAPEPLLAAAEPIPVAEPKAIAKAAGKGTARAAEVPHPAAAPVAPLEAAELPKVELNAVSAKRKK